jgi:chromate reductase
MDTQRDVAVLVGSLRQPSLSRRMALALTRLAPPTLKLDIVEIRDLALYDEDLEKSPPPAWTQFRERIAHADALLFVTPEYNRSVPGALKNALDVGSRPYGKGVWKGKPGAIVSVSPGALGAFGANHHLRQSLVFLDVPTLQQPEAYIGHVGELFDAEGGIGKEASRTFLTSFMSAFAIWIERTGVRS